MLRMIVKPPRTMFLLILILLLNISSTFAQTPTRAQIEDIAKKRYPALFLPKDEYESSAEYKERLKEQKQILTTEKSHLIVEIESLKRDQERLAKEKVASSLSKIRGKITKIGKYNADKEQFVINVQLPGIPTLGYVFSLPSELKNGYFKARIPKDLMSEPSFPRAGNHSVKMSNVNISKTYKVVSRHGDFSKIEIPVIKTKPFTINVPRREAKQFKQNYHEAEVEGLTQLSNDLSTFQVFNLRVSNPITGSIYPIGAQKSTSDNSDYLAGVKDKKVIVPPDLEMRVVFIEPNGNGFLDAKEEGRIKISITNKGKGSAEGVRLKLSENKENRGIDFESSRFVGAIEPNSTKMATFIIKTNSSVSRMMNTITVSAIETYGFPPDPTVLMFETFPLIPPELTLFDYGILNALGDNVIKHGVVSTVQIRIQNRGQGEARNTKFYLQLPEGVYFTSTSRQEYSFSNLQTNEFKDLTFSFHTAKTVGETVQLLVKCQEENSKYEFPLVLDVEKPQKSLAQLVITGKELEKVAIQNVATVSVDIEKSIPKTKRVKKHDLAVVLGIERYKNVPGVTFAKRDATWMKQYFIDVFGIPENRIYFKTDSDVSLATFNVAFGGWLKKRLKKNSNVYVYYAGHGAPDIKENKAYLIPYDGDPNYAAETGLELEELYEQLNELEANSVTVFLDACFTGATRNNEMLLAGARPVFIEVDEAANREITVFSAASSREISSAWPEKKHGLFSYFLMKGCRGEADANKDRQITVEELSDYIRVNVSEMAGMLDREQTPGLQSLEKSKVLIRY